MDLYHYGWVAWLWRLLAGAGVAVAGVLAAAAWQHGDFWLLVMVFPLALPGLVLAPMVAVRIRRLDGDHIEVITLAFWRRRLAVQRLGSARLKTYAQGTVDGVYAPRIWVPVRGGLPIHVDLYGVIPDREAFRRVFSLPGQWLPRR